VVKVGAEDVVEEALLWMEVVVAVVGVVEMGMLVEDEILVVVAVVGVVDVDRLVEDGILVIVAVVGPVEVDMLVEDGILVVVVAVFLCFLCPVDVCTRVEDGILVEVDMLVEGEILAVVVAVLLCFLCLVDVRTRVEDGKVGVAVVCLVVGAFVFVVAVRETVVARLVDVIKVVFVEDEDAVLLADNDMLDLGFPRSGHPTS
jgi:hypothetical protein